ncbi:acid phosphatase [Nocardia farcinica]|nr:acid phosphatase [Nocardia farcinica]MBF6253450.1 acid phosphatase [Nocardia farcinica]MBF6269876.1 acid phosphatase [Nocardia farcinica]MBF6293584.1 acid phosphatase [Nocardia farcinica]MBF6374601.1 acid phosphatase [Nocardia farcinica]
MMEGMPTRENARLVLLRHGETEWSALGRHTGRTDLPLTERGEAQARAAGALLARLDLLDPFVLTSPRLRAVRTAELVGFGGSPVDDDLAEWDYGDYEGRTSAEIQRTDPGWTIWTGTVPGGETRAQVRARADRVLAAVDAVLPERDVLLIGHGHFSRSLIARWAEFDIVEGRRFAMNTAALSVLGFHHDARAVLAHNWIPTTEGAAP